MDVPRQGSDKRQRRKRPDFSLLHKARAIRFPGDVQERQPNDDARELYEDRQARRHYRRREEPAVVPSVDPLNKQIERHNRQAKRGHVWHERPARDQAERSKTVHDCGEHSASLIGNLFHKQVERRY